MYYFGLVLLACVWVMPAPAQEADPDQDLAKELERLYAENERLQDQVDALSAQVDEFRHELAKLRLDNAELAEQVEVSEQMAAEQQAQPAPVIEDRALVIQAERVRGEYNEDRDRTVVTFGPEELEIEGNPGKFYFSIVYSHAGREPMAVDQATLFLQTFRAGRLFNGQDAAEFHIDGEPEQLTITGFDLTPRKTGMAGRTRSDRSDEVVELKLARETLARLGDARSLSVHEGRATVTFNQDDLAAIRAVAQRMGGE